VRGTATDGVSVYALPMTTEVDARSVPAVAGLARLLIRLQVIAVALVFGVAVLLAVAAIPYGGLNFYPFDPDGPGLIDPKTVLPDLFVLDEMISIPVVLYGMVGAFVSAGLAVLGGVALAVGSVRDSLGRAGRRVLAACSLVLAAHPIVMMTPFGADLLTWLLD
jgi:hypothetical protein